MSLVVAATLTNGAQPPSTQPAAGNPPDIKLQTVVDGLRHEVWRCWTTSEGAKTFVAPGAHIELRLGGPYELYFAPSSPLGQRGSEGCTVVSFLPQEMLSFTWTVPPSFSEVRTHRTFVVIRFAEAGPGRTQVTLTHAGWQEGEEWDDVQAYSEQAWPLVLGNLKKRFDTGPIDWPAELRDAASKIHRPAMREYVYYIRPVRIEFFDQPTEAETEAVTAHAAYIRSLLARNILVFAGPSFDPPVFPDHSEQMVPFKSMQAPGIVVFEAATDEPAKRIMEADPAVEAGVFKARLHPFRLAFRRR